VGSSIKKISQAHLGMFFFYFLKGWATPFFKKKNKREQMNLLSADFGNQRSLIFQFKTYFLFKTPRKHFKYLDKHIHGHKKTQKTKINPKLKLFSWTNLSPWARRREKNLGQTPLMKWNLITLKLTIFMARIVINDNFLFLL
jgi:hypothetical protein